MCVLICVESMIEFQDECQPNAFFHRYGDKHLAAADELCEGLNDVFLIK